MPRILYLTTELPYFPGQGGMMALHVRHLSTTQLLGVVGPRYPHQPEDALQRMRDTANRSYWWPEHPVPGDFLIPPVLWNQPTKWLKHLPKGLQRRLWNRLTGLNRLSCDALAWRSVLANLAPKILEALRDEKWNIVLLSQSTSAAWLPFLPASLARCIYFHDIRSDYLRRAITRPSRSNLHGVRQEELAAARETDAITVVSSLDQRRANDLLRPTSPIAVAPICIDLDYFAFEPPPTDAEPVVLFTGHLSHPPNVDAVVHFLEAIWPQIASALPAATFKVVGLHPAQAITDAIAKAQRVELHPNAPDIRPYFRRSRVYVVPMRYGGGVRQKILESWAIGLPVITTTMGAEGIAAEDGANCWLRDEPENFAAQVIELLSEPAPRSVLQAARALVEKQHSAEASCPAFAAQLAVAVNRKRAAPPRILYDLRWLEPGKSGGVEQATRELVDELASYDRTFDYRFHGSQRVFRDWRFSSGFRHKVICTDGQQARWLHWRDVATAELAAELRLPQLMNAELRALEWYTRLDFTIVHGLPCHVHQDLRRFPSVVTMHDLQHLHYPNFFSPTDIAIREKEYRESCQLASHVICISEFTRQDVHERYGIPLAKMTTIWNLPPRLTGAPIADSTKRRRLNAMGIKTPFLFFPAHPWLHKNHHGLLKAMQIADQSLPADYKLVLTGQPFPADHPAAALLLEPAIRRRVVHLGYRSPLEIAALFGSAEALIFPSLFEGFGMPLIEAMQQSCPIVCGRHTSLPEVCGEAALYADVAQPEALAEAILTITRDAALRARLRKCGHENLRRFNRRRLADQTRAVYQSVHDQHFS